MDELNKAWSDASTQMYQQAGATPSTDPNAGGPGPQDAPPSGDSQAGKPNGNVEEADYTVVDEK
jgi:hypothetical protein